MFMQDYSGYNKVFMFLTTELVNRMARKLDNELPKGSKIVSVLFKFDDEFVSNKRSVELNNFINNLLTF